MAKCKTFNQATLPKISTTRSNQIILNLDSAIFFSSFRFMHTKLVNLQNEYLINQIDLIYINAWVYTL